MSNSQTYRAGQSVPDLCRVCKGVRDHRVFVTDGDGQILKTQCDYCGSLHRYRRGGASTPPPVRRKVPKDLGPRLVAIIPEKRAPGGAHRQPSGALVAEAELISQGQDINLESGDTMEIERLLRQVIREELGIQPVELASKWEGGTVTINPGNPDLKSKEIPIETFFSKVISVRNKLRVLEQQVNKSDLSGAEKVKIQGYITGCYGSLTTFNVLFADEGDRFKGSGS